MTPAGRSASPVLPPGIVPVRDGGFLFNSVFRCGVARNGNFLFKLGWHVDGKGSAGKFKPFPLADLTAEKAKYTTIEAHSLRR